ncbi:MAG TPA: DUF819 family protein [Longimicrobiales bacterium]|nr:DUF819 family protein [Longimicrobiales bacterium]
MQADPATALLSDPAAVFAYLAGVIAFVFWLSGLPALKKIFAITPPVIYAYFIPTLSTAAGITPLSSPAYAWMTRYLLPVALILLMISVDLRAIIRLGRMALVMMLAGTVGIIIGGPVALLVFGQWLPADAWKGFAALSGSWIGGTANLVAMAESVGASAEILAPVIVVDTVVGYGWMGMLLLLSAYQARFDRWNRADTRVIEETNRRMATLEDKRRPTELRDLLIIIGFAFVAATLAIAAGGMLPRVGDPTIISATTWAVLIVVTAGLLLSFTPVQRLEQVGASRVGYAALYLLLTAIGAQADLRAVLQTPLFFAAGALWLLIHLVVLFAVARMVRAPLFFVATGSMANIGGAVSAPVVAGVYHPALAPVGLLLGVAGYILGIYGALACAWLLARVAG